MESTSLVVITEDNRFNRKLTKFQCYLTYFFIFSFVGWLMETIYSYFVLGHFANRGFLFGPVCPIYGFGGLILILFLEIELNIIWFIGNLPKNIICKKIKNIMKKISLRNF